MVHRFGIVCVGSVVGDLSKNSTSLYLRPGPLLLYGSQSRTFLRGIYGRVMVRPFIRLLRVYARSWFVYRLSTLVL